MKTLLMFIGFIKTKQESCILKELRVILLTSIKDNVPEIDS